MAALPRNRNDAPQVAAGGDREEVIGKNGPVDG